MQGKHNCQCFENPCGLSWYLNMPRGTHGISVLLFSIIINSFHFCISPFLFIKIWILGLLRLFLFYIHRMVATFSWEGKHFTKRHRSAHFLTFSYLALTSIACLFPKDITTPTASTLQHFFVIWTRIVVPEYHLID